MPNAKDMIDSLDMSILLVGEPGTHKTWFLGTCPAPIWIADFDKGTSVLRGNEGVDYDTFREVAPGEKARSGLYEFGTAWPALLKRVNEIGRTLDDGTCKYKTLALDSLTFMSDICKSFILKSNNRTDKQFAQGSGDVPRAEWGAFLNNMNSVIGQIISWPIAVKVVTAHVQRTENDLTKTVEMLPLMQGQMQSKVTSFFDEVYYTKAEAKTKDGKKAMSFTLQTMPDGIVRAAKSRRWNIPDGTETDFRVLARLSGTKF